MAKSVTDGNTKQQPIQVVDMDVCIGLPDQPVPLNTILEVNSDDTCITELNQFGRVDVLDLNVLSTDETAEVSKTVATMLARLVTTEGQSAYSSGFDNIQTNEERDPICKEDENELWNQGYTAKCIRVKDNTFAYAGQSEW